MRRAVDPPDPGAGLMGCWVPWVKEGTEAAATHCHPPFPVVREEKGMGLLECVEGTSCLTERIPNPLIWEIAFLLEKPIFRAARGDGGCEPS